MQKLVMIHPGVYAGARERKLQKSRHSKFSMKSNTKTFNCQFDFGTPSDVHMFWESYNEKRSIVRLSVKLVGNTTVPDLQEYSKSVTEVQFSGHICSIRTALKMVAQLQACESVEFFIGDPEQLPFLEKETDREVDLKPNPAVTSLLIRMTHPDESQKNKEFLELLQYQLKSLFTNAVNTFPNLKKLNLDLPGTGFNFDLTEKHLRGWINLKHMCVAEIRNCKVVIAIKPQQENFTKAGQPTELRASEDGNKQNSGTQKPTQDNLGNRGESRKRKSSESGPQKLHTNEAYLSKQGQDLECKDPKIRTSDYADHHSKLDQRHESPESKNYKSCSDDYPQKRHDNINPGVFGKPTEFDSKAESNSDYPYEKPFNWQPPQHKIFRPEDNNPFVLAEQNHPDVKPFQLNPVKTETPHYGAYFGGGQTNVPNWNVNRQYERNHDWHNCPEGDFRPQPFLKNMMNHQNLGGPRNLIPQERAYDTHIDKNYHHDPSCNDNSMVSTDEDEDSSSTAVPLKVPPQEFQSQFDRRRPADDSSQHSTVSTLVDAPLPSSGPPRLDLLFYQMNGFR